MNDNRKMPAAMDGNLPRRMVGSFFEYPADESNQSRVFPFFAGSWMPLCSGKTRSSPSSPFLLWPSAIVLIGLFLMLFGWIYFSETPFSPGMSDAEDIQFTSLKPLFAPLNLCPPLPSAMPVGTLLALLPDADDEDNDSSDLTEPDTSSNSAACGKGKRHLRNLMTCRLEFCLYSKRNSFASQSPPNQLNSINQSWQTERGPPASGALTLCSVVARRMFPGANNHRFETS